LGELLTDQLEKSSGAMLEPFTTRLGESLAPMISGAVNPTGDLAKVMVSFVEDFVEEIERFQYQGIDISIAQFQRQMDDFAKALEREAPLEGSFEVDLFSMVNVHTSEKERIEATDRLLSQYFRTPIHPFRWAAVGVIVIQEIRERAASHGVSFEEEYRRHVRASFHGVAMEAAGHFSFRQTREAIRSVKRALNDALTEDILGSDWRQKSRHQEFVDGEDGNQAPDLNEVELSLLLRSKNLTDSEVELGLLRLQGFSYTELAAQLKTTPGALRTAWHRTKKKLAS